MKNKKGILGIDTVKAVIIMLMMIAIITIVMFAILIPLRTAVESIDSQTYRVYNQSLPTTVNSTRYIYVDAERNLRNPVCTFIECMNNTELYDPVPTANYTISNCGVIYSGVKDAGGFNNSAWKCSYSATYDQAGTNNLVENMTSGPLNFFENVPTFFTLLGVVVLILIITIVIVAVSRFTTGGGIGIGGGESSSGFKSI